MRSRARRPHAMLEDVPRHGARPVLVARPTPASRLPASSTSFVGRDRELAVLDTLLLEDIRLVTLVGPGGAGKTRLALQVARQHELRGEVGEVFFCDLSAARSAAEMVASLSARLGVWLDRSTEGDDASGQLGRAIASRGPILIVLDNFEQLEPQAALAVAAWLSMTQARFLVTSREPLRIAAERCCEIGALATTDGLALFEARARAMDALLLITDDDRCVMAEIVARLDGLPLAIELAAAKVKAMTPAQILDGLSSRFDLLRSPHRDVDPRHATLACAIDWSWDLLGDLERAALAQCSVFRGGFDLAAARGVLDIDAPIAELLESLVNRSLVRTDLGGTGAARRFHLYETVRDYAAHKLAHTDAEARAEERHATWFLERAEAWANAMPIALASLATEGDNIVAIAHRHETRDPRLAARAVLALDPLLLLRGPFDFHRELLEFALRCAERASDRLLIGRALHARGAARVSCGDLGGAHEDLTRALELARGDVALKARVLRVLARAEHIAGKRQGAAALYTRAIEAARRAGDERLLALSMGDQGDLLSKPERVSEALERVVRSNDRHTETHLRWTLGRVERDLDHHVEASAQLEHALELSREVGARRLEGLIVGSLASAQHFAGKTDDAMKTYRRSIELHANMGNTMMHGWMLTQLAGLAHEVNRLAEAHTFLIEALRLGRAARSPRTEGMALAHLGALFATWGRIGEATEHFDAARRRIHAGDAESLAALHVLEGLLLVARARMGESSNGAATNGLPAAGLLGEATERRDAITDPARRAHLLAKIAARVLTASLSRSLDGTEPRADGAPCSGEALEVGPDASWCRIEGGEEIDLAKREALRRILGRLIDKREGAPSRAAPASELIAAGWPGERMTPSSANNRLRNAVATLRHLGLRDVILTRNDGYMIDPDRPVVRR